MATVLTLDGMKMASLENEERVCTKIEAFSPVLNHNVTVCSEDLRSPMPMAAGPKRRGRPKGRTIKAGAKRPVHKTCNNFVTVTQKSGRKVCMCGDSGNKVIARNSKCGF